MHDSADYNIHLMLTSKFNKIACHIQNIYVSTFLYARNIKRSRVLGGKDKFNKESTQREKSGGHEREKSEGHENKAQM